MISVNDLTILSWNIEGRVKLPYHKQNIWTLYDKYDKIFNIINNTNCDIVCLQEISIDDIEYISLNINKKCVCINPGNYDHVAIFTNMSVAKINITTHINDLCNVNDSYLYINDADICLYTCHLPSGSSSSKYRYNIIKSTYNNVKLLYTCPFVIIGDLNIRAPEVQLIDMLGIHLAYVRGLPTFNMQINDYYGEYGKVAAYYDRIGYDHDIIINEYELIGNYKVDDAYLSDHFGIFCKIKVIR